MIDDCIKKRVNKKRKKKHNEMYLDDYAKKNNIDININFKYEDETEDRIKNIENSNNSNLQYEFHNKNSQNVETPKNKIRKYKDENKDSRKESETEDYIYNSNKSGNLFSQKQGSFSTINSSIDDDKNNNNTNTNNNNNNSSSIINNDINSGSNKKYNNFINNNLSEREKRIAEIIKNKINDSYEEGIRNKIANAIKNLKIKEYKMNNDNKIFPSNNNFNNNININYPLNNNYNRILFNKNNNFNYINFYKYNFQNKNNIYNINYINYLISSNYNNYRKSLLLNKNNLNKIQEQISLLEGRDVNDIYLFNQLNKIFAYIKSKTKELDTNKKNDEKEGPEHPYFYMNHLEEIQIKNVLFLIEGIFLEENLKKDFNLLRILNREGYASLKQLEKHPLIIKCNNISKEHLKTVFSEHRENEVTETVETFDDILIRNRKWKHIKKEIGDINELEKLCMDDIEKNKKSQIDKLLEKKKKIEENNKNLLLQYKINDCSLQQNKMKFLQFNYNYNYNICYNNIYNNNVYGLNYYNY